MDRLPKLTSRITIAITQYPSLKKNISNDFVRSFYRHNRCLLYFMKKFPDNKIMKSIMEFTKDAFLCYYIEKIIYLQHYQEIWDSYYQEIDKTLKELGIEIELDGVNDISGWSLVNADYASWFGCDKRVSITSGTCYFIHVLCRCMQPFIIEYQQKEKMWRILDWSFNRKFRKSILGLLTQNHIKAISKWHLIPEDESLLFGAEQFILLHEMGHAYFESVNEFVWPFPLKPSLSILKRMEDDEEIKADIFALYSLYYLYKKDKSQKLLLFAPIFFFLIYSWLEDSLLLKKPKSHPESKDRYSYLMSEVQLLEYNRCYFEYVSILNSLWSKNKTKVCIEVQHEINTISKYEVILEGVYKKMKDYLDEVSEGNL